MLLEKQIRRTDLAPCLRYNVRRVQVLLHSFYQLRAEKDTERSQVLEEKV